MVSGISYRDFKMSSFINFSYLLDVNNLEEFTNRVYTELTIEIFHRKLDRSRRRNRLVRYDFVTPCFDLTHLNIIQKIYFVTEFKTFQFFSKYLQLNDSDRF